MSYKKTLTEGSTRTPEQQRAAEATAKQHPGRNPAPDADKMGVQPDGARQKREQNLDKSTPRRG
jgi:hypothetical protein